MNAPLNNDNRQNDYAAFIAIDWADRQHVFSLQVAGQSTKETGTLEQKPEVIGPWVAKLRERFGGRLVAIAVEQSRGALIHALLSYDFIVIYPLHPWTVALKEYFPQLLELLNGNLASRLACDFSIKSPPSKRSSRPSPARSSAFTMAITCAAHG